MYNNQFGYNPYYQPIMPNNQQFNAQQSIAQNNQTTALNNAQNRQLLNGKLVDSIEVAKNVDYPLDGSISYFPTIDGTAIVTKQLKQDGTSKTIIYKPFEEKEMPKTEYVTMEDLKKAISEFDLSDIDDLKDEVKELKLEIKKIKKGE